MFICLHSCARLYLYKLWSDVLFSLLLVMNLFIVAFWCVQVCVCICVHACVCVCVCLYVCVCACLHVCVFEGNFCCHPIFVCFLSFFSKHKRLKRKSPQDTSALKNSCPWWPKYSWREGMDQIHLIKLMVKGQCVKTFFLMIFWLSSTVSDYLYWYEWCLRDESDQM